MKIVDLDNVFIHANSGRVISLFVNVSLACDYRIVADNTVFQNPYIELGLALKGGGPFFLSKKLGFSKAYEMLLFRNEMNAYETLRLGIVDKIVPLAKVEGTDLKVAHRFGEKPSRTLSGVKRLLNYFIQDLEGYLELENQELLRIVRPYLWK